MKSIVNNNVVFLRSLRFVLLGIIIFTLGAGNAFPIVAHHIRVKSAERALEKQMSSEAAYIPNNGSQILKTKQPTITGILHTRSKNRRPITTRFCHTMKTCVTAIWHHIS